MLLSDNIDDWTKIHEELSQGRLFTDIKWPKDPELVDISLFLSIQFQICAFSLRYLIYIDPLMQKDFIKRLHSLITIKDSAANVPKNWEARRRLQFFTNSLFMKMPAAKPVSEMLSFR